MIQQQGRLESVMMSGALALVRSTDYRKKQVLKPLQEWVECLYWRDYGCIFHRG